MFGRKSKTLATDMYVQNMLSGILEELSGMRIYLTQCKLKYSQVWQAICPPDWEVEKYRPYANKASSVEFNVLYTSLESPRRHGREGVFPISPSAEGTLIMTSSVQGFVRWDVLRASASIRDGVGDCEREDWYAYFVESEKMINDEHPVVSPALMRLSEELMHRRPATFSSRE